MKKQLLSILLAVTLIVAVMPFSLGITADAAMISQRFAIQGLETHWTPERNYTQIGYDIGSTTFDGENVYAFVRNANDNVAVNGELSVSDPVCPIYSYGRAKDSNGSVILAENARYMLVTYYYDTQHVKEGLAASKIMEGVNMAFNLLNFCAASGSEDTTRNSGTVYSDHGVVCDQWDTVSFDLTALPNYDAAVSAGEALRQLKLYVLRNSNSGSSLPNFVEGEAMYIKSIVFCNYNTAEAARTHTAYVSADGAIDGVSSSVFTSIADAITALGEDGGDVIVEGDIEITSGDQFEASRITRGDITVSGYGATLAEKQQNRIWFKSLDAGRTIPLGGTVIFDNITIKAPVDEGGLSSNGGRMVFGENLNTEKTVKNSITIDASGDKSMTVNFGGYYNSGSNVIDVYGGSFGDVSSFYLYSGNLSYGGTNTYNLYGGSFNNLYAGARNSYSGVITLNGGITYNISGGTFNNVTTGHFSNGILNGDAIYNITGGTFTQGVNLGNTNNATTAKVANVAIVIDAAGVDNAFAVKTGKALEKTSSEKTHTVVINRCDKGEVTFDASLIADYKVMVAGGTAEPVFDDGVLAGFSITADNDNMIPYIGDTLLTAEAGGLYTLPLGETAITFRGDLGITETDFDNVTDANRSTSFSVEGVQIRLFDQGSGTVDQGMRFVAVLGKDVLAKFEALNTDNKKPSSSSDTGVGYGFLVAPTEKVTGELTMDSAKKTIVPAVNTYKTIDETDNKDSLQFTVCLLGIDAAHWTNEITARPYITYKDALGNVYTAYGEAYTTSVYDAVEYGIEHDPDNKDALQELMDAYIAETTK